VLENILLRNKENDKFGKEEEKSFEEQNMKNMLQCKDARRSMSQCNKTLF